MARDLFVALFGALVIVLAGVGLFVVEDRAGPLEATFTPSTVVLVVSGHYQTSSGSGTIGPGGTCVPEPPATTCRSPGTELELQITGLPAMGPAHYVLFLTGGADRAERIGTLAHTGQAHTVELTDDEDRSDRTQLLVTLERDPAPSSPSTLVVHRQSVGPRTSDTPRDLDTRTTTILEPADGTVVVDQIGMVGVSATAKGTLSGLAPKEEWTYRAWLRDDTGSTTVYTYLDALMFDTAVPGEAVLDARVERVRVDPQDVVLVTLEPRGVPPDAQPGGWPIVEAPL